MRFIAAFSLLPLTLSHPCFAKESTPKYSLVEEMPTTIDDVAFQYALGNIKEAERGVERLLRSSPYSSELLTLAAQIYLADGKVDEASYWNNKALDIDPSYPAALHLKRLIDQKGVISKQQLKDERRQYVINLGNELEVQGKYDKALELFLKAELDDPDYPVYLFRIGLIYSQKREWHKAQNYFLAALYHKSDYTEVRIFLAETYYFEAEYDKADKQIQLVLAEMPDRVDALMIAADIALAENRFRQARDYYRRALQIQPGFTEAKIALRKLRGKLILEKEFRKSDVLGEHHIPMSKRADKLEEEGEYDKALFLYQHLLDDDPDNGWYLFRAGSIAAKMEDWDLSQKYFERALVEDPYNHDARIGLAGVFYHYGNLGRALKEVEVVLGQNPENRDALFLAAQIMVLKGEFAEAKTYYNKAVEIDSDDPENQVIYQKIKDERYQATFVRPLVFRGMEYEKNGEYLEALDLYMQVYDQNPNDIHVIYLIGRIYARMQQWIPAEGYLKLCIAKDPAYLDAYITLSYVYYWQKNYSESLKMAQYVIERDPKYVDAYIAAGRAARLGGNIPQAEQYLEEALALNPSSHEATLALAQLNEARRHYFEAYKEFLDAYKTNKFDLMAQKGVIALKPYVRPSFDAVGFFAQEREQDLIEKISTTQITTFDDRIKITFPYSNAFEPYLGVGYVLDDQYNMISRVSNFRINNMFQDIGGIVRFGDYWSLDVESRLHFARGKGKVNLFPFIKTTVWEPKAIVHYKVPEHHFTVGTFKDTVIARFFSISRSALIRRKWLLSSYEYRFKEPFNAIGASGDVGWYGGRIKNREQNLSTWVRFRIPTVVPDLLVRYQFFYRGFEKVLRDYNSFKWRNEHHATLTFQKEWIPTTHFEMSYTWMWSSTHQLTDQSEIIIAGQPSIPQPINKNIFRANVGEALIRHVCHNSCHFEFAGRYYHNTNRYRAWELRGNMLLVF